MSWLQVKNKHKQALINFVVKDEWAHVSFSEKLKTGQHGYTVIADYIDASSGGDNPGYGDTSGRSDHLAGAAAGAQAGAGAQTSKTARAQTNKTAGAQASTPAGAAAGAQARLTGGTPFFNFRKLSPIPSLHHRLQRSRTASIGSAILFSRYGVMFPIFSETSLKNIEKLETYIKGFRRNIYSVMGIKNDVVAAERLLKLNPHTEINYYLMVITAEEFLKKHNLHGAKDTASTGYETGKLNIKRAAVRNAKNLFPLERDYQLEEVIINPKNYNPRFILENFKNTLAKNIVLFAEKDGVPVSKAGTNAQGFYTDQIGGVFTVKQERGKGFAREVMIRLLSCIFKEKKTASLFVKRKNIPAVKLYENLGFKIMNDFRICYF